MILLATGADEGILAIYYHFPVTNVTTVQQLLYTVFVLNTQ